MNPLPVVRSEIRLGPDPKRVIARPFLPGEQNYPDGRSRLEVVLDRILAMSDADVATSLRRTVEEFADRHRDLDSVLEASLSAVGERIDLPTSLSEDRRRLVGAYFTHEYSIEAAALGNPSMVPAPDQSALPTGTTRFVMSLRAVGEGHISSIEFRTGLIDEGLTITIDEPARFVETGRRSSPDYDKGFFVTKLGDLGAMNELARAILDGLDDRFTMHELESTMAALEGHGIDLTISFETRRLLHWLASSNYKVAFRESSSLSERVIFPGGPTESHGMEDARLVRFVDDDGSEVYYGTYTAYDGFQILPQLIETTDFVSFRIATLTGERAQNKGIALFPRKLEGRYAALARHDNVNNFLMTSTDVRVWRDSELIQEPERPWELIQLGNCGSPLETEAGWLVITHGVGPFRRYALGALLLDLGDPCRVIGHLAEPLLVAGVDEREGYVPNVVYSCGSMIHGEHLVLPYGFADVGAGFATVRLEELLMRLTG